MLNIWRAFWGELNTPFDFSDQPYYGALNQIGHIAIGREAVTLICAGLASVGWPVDAWFVAMSVVTFYAVAIELWRQKWMGADTIVDTAFVALGATYAPLALQLTPSGRWVRTEEATMAVVCWIVIVVAALALYVYPRAKRKYDKQEQPPF